MMMPAGVLEAAVGNHRRRGVVDAATSEGGSGSDLPNEEAVDNARRLPPPVADDGVGEEGCNDDAEGLRSPSILLLSRGRVCYRERGER